MSINTNGNSKYQLYEELSNIKIENLADLSNRIKKALRYKQIITLQQLLNTDFRELETVRNLGKKSLEELKEYLNNKGYRLLNEHLFVSATKDEYLKKGKKLLETDGFPSMVYTFLYSHGIYTLDELIEKGDSVYQLKGLGPKKEQAMRQHLNTLNITLKKSKEEPLPTTLPHVDSIKKTKEQLLAEYETLLLEKSDLLVRLIELDKKIILKANQIELAEDTKSNVRTKK